MGCSSHFEQQFQHPPKEFKPMPFWHINGELTTEGIKQQMKDAKELGGFSGISVLPRAPKKNGRPGTTPKFLSKEYINRFQDVLNTAEELDMQVILYDDNDFSTYDKTSNDITVVSPGIMPSNKMVKESKNIISEYDLFSDIMPFSIWISGTNGKTTTTQMCQHILKDRDSLCGGNIGTPLAKLDKDVNIWILETSSFTLHYTNKAKPNLYILLPISEDHISWHGSYEAYKEALKRIY